MKRRLNRGESEAGQAVPRECRMPLRVQCVRLGQRSLPPIPACTEFRVSSSAGRSAHPQRLLPPRSLPEQEAPPGRSYGLV